MNCGKIVWEEVTLSLPPKGAVKGGMDMRLSRVRIGRDPGPFAPPLPGLEAQRSTLPQVLPGASCQAGASASALSLGGMGHPEWEFAWAQMPEKASGLPLLPSRFPSHPPPHHEKVCCSPGSLGAC